MADSFDICVSKYLHADDTIFVVGNEPDTSKFSGRIQRPGQYPTDMNYLVSLLRSGFRINIFRIGYDVNSHLIFDYYIGLVSEGGIIIIDNYEEFKSKLYLITLDNNVPETTTTLGKFTTLYCSGGKIILQKEHVKSNIKFGIVMATYHRKNDKSKEYVERSLQSILKQSYKNYRVFLIGDRYEDKEEFESFSNLLPFDKIEAINLPMAWERDNCRISTNLWAIGGANAMNYGMDLALKQGYNHYVHLDDDDYWHPFHLRNVATGYEQFPEACFVATYAINNARAILPAITGLGYNNFTCRMGGAFHSSYGFRLDMLQLRYDTLNLNGPEVKYVAADAVLLEKIEEVRKKNNYKVLGIPIISCFHDDEGTVLSNPPQNMPIIKDPLTNAIEKSRSDLIVGNISKDVKTFHHHYHLLYDLRTLLGRGVKTYMEIGVYYGGSLVLMMQHPYETKLIGIDIFQFPDQYDTLCKNLDKYNKYKREVTIYKENSHSIEFVEKLKGCRVDILFIDGDHSKQGVISDFEMFSQFVNPDGYIVFDDYHDLEHSPEVKPAVDLIVERIKSGEYAEYEVIGFLPNFLNVHPETIRNYNEFIIQKKLS